MTMMRKRIKKARMLTKKEAQSQEISPGKDPSQPHQRRRTEMKRYCYYKLDLDLREGFGAEFII